MYRTEVLDGIAAVRVFDLPRSLQAKFNIDGPPSTATVIVMPARSQSGAGSSDSDEAEERRAALNRSSSDNLQVNLDNEDDDHEVDEGEYSISSVDDAELESAAKKARIVLSEYEKRRKSAPSTPTGTRHRRVAADPDRSGDGGSSGAAMRLRKRKATGSPDDRNVRRAGASTRSEGCRTPGRSSVDWDDDAEREIEERRERLEANQAEKMQRFKDLTQGLTDEEKAQMRPPSTRLPWTREELLALEEGVKKLGASWAKIRDTYPIFSQTGRSNIMLERYKSNERSKE
ncbi:hypothetical protein HK101_011700 [Irineochytrium annulatum]|nr:hypothetical protein HK101_011700 [Irineochytrium annulatum]